MAIKEITKKQMETVQKRFSKKDIVTKEINKIILKYNFSDPNKIKNLLFELGLIGICLLENYGVLKDEEIFNSTKNAFNKIFNRNIDNNTLSILFTIKIKAFEVELDFDLNSMT